MQNQPAYIIYTSGSTGRPKGVLVDHAAISQHCAVMKDYYSMTPQDRVLQFTPLTFDASLEQILVAWTSGAAVVLRGNDIWSTDDFYKNIASYKVTVADLPPSYLDELLIGWNPGSGDLPGEEFRLMIVGGETLPLRTAKKWIGSGLGHLPLINAYGPTETTVTRTAFNVSSDEWDCITSPRVPIGRPVSGTAVYLLDRSGRPVPEGFPGELCIGREGLARGYVGDPELSAQKFAANPFIQDVRFGETRLYHTGDLARFIPGTNGLLDYLGRIDRQIKVRGYRDEPGEVEMCIKAIPGVIDAAVVTVDFSEQGSRLAVYYSLSLPEITSDEIKDRVKERLPSHMVPSYFVLLDEIPRSSLGEIIETALPQPKRTSNEVVKSPLESEIEIEVGNIWSQCLDHSDVALEDNFFDCGGDSILAVRLVALIRKQFGIDLSISRFLTNPTVEDLVRMVERNEKTSETGVPLVCLKKGDEASPLFLVHAVGGDVYSYADLAKRVGETKSVYAFRSPALDAQEYPETIEKMAASYVTAMRKIQPAGAYYLGGWSMGGVVAYEMARQLESSGDEVEMLLLIESYTPSQVIEYERSLLKSTGLDEGDAESPIILSFANDRLRLDNAVLMRCMKSADGDSERLWEHLMEHVSKTGIDSKGVGPEQLQREYAAFKAHTLAMNRYKPESYSGKIALVYGDKAPPDGLKEWSKLSGGGVELIKVPGDHYAVFEDSAIDTIAEWLSRRLNLRIVESRVGLDMRDSGEMIH